MGKRALRALDEEYDPLKQRPTKRRTTAKDPASDSDSSQATKTSTGQRKGGRTRVACDQCSKRRSRCSLEGPVCDSCQRRDEPCSYESLIWIENVEDLPSRQLRRKLDALEALIGSLSRRSIPLSPSISPVIVPIEIPPVPPPSEFARKSVSPSSSPSRHLLVRSLFVNGTLQQVELPGINTALLEYELRRLDNAFFLSTVRPPPAVPTSLPTPPQAHLAICFFSSTINPTFRLVHEPSFFRDCQTFWASGAVASPTWLALYLATCSAGFRVVLADEEAIRQSGLGEDEIAQLADKCWTESRETLEGEGFPLVASLETIQVALTLALSSLHGDTSNVSRMASLVSMAVNSALDLEVNVDPYEQPGNLTPLEVEMRRRTFWALYSCESIINLLLGKEASSLCTVNPSVRRPLFLSNDCYLPSGLLSPAGISATTRPLASSPTSSVLTVATLAVRVLDLDKAGGVSDEASITRLLTELDSYDGAFRSSPAADSLFHATYLRLHQIAKDFDVTTIKQNAAAARHLDALLRAAVAKDFLLPPDLAFFSSALAMSAAVRSCLAHSDDQFGFERDRNDLRNFALSIANSSRLPALRLAASRCSLLINQLLGQDRRSSTDASPSLASSSIATPSDITLPSPAASAPMSALEPLYGLQQLPLPYLANDFQPGPVTFAPFYPTIDTHVPQIDSPTVPDLPSRSLCPPPPNRPLLSLRTSLAPGGHNKPATPTFSPWQDASQTPSRYVGYAWDTL